MASRSGATPGGALLAVTPAARLALHFHDTRGMGAANVRAALDLGSRTFDASAGGGRSEKGLLRVPRPPGSTQ